MSYFIHLHFNLTVRLKGCSEEDFKTVFQNLEKSSLLIPSEETRMIYSEELPKYESPIIANKQEIWKYNDYHSYIITNELGVKFRFHPALHLNYLERKQTRQGFHIFYEPTFEDSPKKYVTLNFYKKSKRFYKTEASSFIDLVKNLNSNVERDIRDILCYDWKVLNEFNSCFFLKSDLEFTILTNLYQGSKPKFRIQLKNPKSPIRYNYRDQEYIIPFLKSLDIVFFILEYSYNVPTFSDYIPNIRNPEEYYQLEPGFCISITDAKQIPSGAKKCKCGGMISNNNCTTHNCPIYKKSNT